MSWLLYPLLFALGGLTGLAWARLRQPDGRVRELETHLQALQEKQESYQEAVYQHFSRTAGLVNQLSQQYQLVHQHLKDGASQLCPPLRKGGNPASLFEHINTNTDANSVFTDDTELMEPPRDYATKKPTEKGMLDEDFGLKR